MTDDAHVDGNAIGGLLIEVFGQEMTDALGAARIAVTRTRSVRSSSTAAVPATSYAVPVARRS